ncbi:hypothetical protein [Dankookia sp. P2]|uniref:hypothetical protein n=1 Tax=Dankookia sp. P2 TaxID=3423955 RepID=UPI003D674E42
MLFDDDDITARGAVRRSRGVLKHPSDITRVEERRALLEKYQARQREVRFVAEKADKTSKPRLVAAIAERDNKIAELERDRELLIASHRAVILAVGEMGGMRAWLKLFEAHDAALRRLDAIGAMPPAEACVG